MRVSTKARFAVTAMTDLAMSAPGLPVSIATIARRHHISLSYLEQLIGRLRRHGLVGSIRGPGGGYVLTREAQSISVADIVAAVDDADGSSACDAHEASWAAGRRCDMNDFWQRVDAKLMEALGAISLRALAAEQLANGVAVAAAPPRSGISSEPVVKPIRTHAPNSVFALATALDDQSWQKRSA